MEYRSGENISITMSDSYGDGWNGNILHIGKFKFNLSSGSYGVETACLPWGTYTPYACGGKYSQEAAFTVAGISGRASESCVAALASAVNMTISRPNTFAPNSTEAYIDGEWMQSDSSEVYTRNPHPNVLFVEFTDERIAAGDLPNLRILENEVTQTTITVTEAVRGKATVVPEVQVLKTLCNTTNATRISGFFTLRLGATGNTTQRLFVGDKEDLVNTRSTSDQSKLVATSVNVAAELSRISGRNVSVSRHSATTTECNGTGAYVWSVTFLDFSSIGGDIALLLSGNGSCGELNDMECWLLADGDHKVQLEANELVRGVAPIWGNFVLELTDRNAAVSGKSELIGFDGKSQWRQVSGVIPSDASSASMAAALRFLPLGRSAVVTRADYPISNMTGSIWFISGLGNIALRALPVGGSLHGVDDWCLNCASDYSSVSGNEGRGCAHCTADFLPLLTSQPRLSSARKRNRQTLRGDANSLNAALRSLMYCPAQDWNSQIGGIGMVGVSIAIEGGAPSSKYQEVHVLPVNDAPIIKMPVSEPGYLRVLQNEELNLAGIAVIDPDFTFHETWGGEVVVEAAVKHGILSLSTPSGRAFADTERTFTDVPQFLCKRFNSQQAERCVQHFDLRNNP